MTFAMISNLFFWMDWILRYSRICKVPMTIVRNCMRVLQIDMEIGRSSKFKRERAAKSDELIIQHSICVASHSCSNNWHILFCIEWNWIFSNYATCDTHTHTHKPTFHHLLSHMGTQSTMYWLKFTCFCCQKICKFVTVGSTTFHSFVCSLVFFLHLLFFFSRARPSIIRNM